VWLPCFLSVRHNVFGNHRGLPSTVPFLPSGLPGYPPGSYSHTRCRTKTKFSPLLLLKPQSISHRRWTKRDCRENRCKPMAPHSRREYPAFFPTQSLRHLSLSPLTVGSARSPLFSACIDPNSGVNDPASLSRRKSKNRIQIKLGNLRDFFDQA
jgi:hypothetical protein